MSDSTEIVVPAAGVNPHLQPWQEIKWTDDQLQAMYTDWGAYFARTQHLKLAKNYLDAALELNPNCVNSLKKRSKIKRMQALASEAFDDCSKAKSILQKKHESLFDPENRMEICDSLYESNSFEIAKLHLHNDLRLNAIFQKEPVLNRLRVCNANLQDALSNETAPAVGRLIKKMNFDMSRQPKKVKSDCDVLSTLENKKESLSKLEIERRKRQYQIYNQKYLQNCGVDVLFLKKTRTSQTLLLEQCVQSSPYLKELAEESSKTIRAFTKMLHTRCPMYCSNLYKFPNMALYLKHEQNNLYRIQYQTKRNMNSILRTIRNLIRTNDLQKLSIFVEDVLGNYVTVKTNRIMPWKFEFINEVCNYLGLARINDYKIPGDMKVLLGKQRLLTLFKLPNIFSNISTVRFTTFQQIKRDSLEDVNSENLKNRMKWFKYRMKFAKYSIERSYLLHEAALAHLENHSFDTCCVLARKSMNEALRGNNYVWAVLSALIACKAHAILGKVEKQMEMLAKALKLAKLLKNIDLVLFIDVCLKISTDEIDLKESIAPFESNTKVKASLENTFPVTDIP